MRGGGSGADIKSVVCCDIRSGVVVGGEGKLRLRESARRRRWMMQAPSWRLPSHVVGGEGGTPLVVDGTHGSVQ